ncbi:phosphotransferase [Micromonospora sp. NPDC049679]|uniref:phosphotransferase family protein n=1 Tax=Micromonospora sp. NPDC049679 TaxID=3155920 RepID=UPI0033C39BDF
MLPISVPPVPYGATAVRPDWADLPAALRDAITARIGVPVTAAVTAGGGFTRGFAAVLTAADGDRVFVKAASRSDQPHVADWYAREAAITAILPAVVPAPRLRWTLDAAGHTVVCFDAIDGRMPRLPWAPDDLDATLTAWATAAAALREPPAELLRVGLPTLADLLRADLSWWGEIVAGREALPAVPSHAAARLAELAALEAALPAYATGGGVIHCDLRLDNVLIDGGGAAWICDWNWPCLGPAWFDTAGLLVTAYASGLDADALFAAHPTARDAPADALDATLAALCGHWLTRSAAGATDASPHLRAHARWSGGIALTWLSARRGWS